MKPRLFVAAGAAILWAWFFAPALIGTASFAFRDAAHYYHPQFEYARAEWGAGRVPLWNPYENLGVPLAAENTSSVFYPGKLLFALPVDFVPLYGWYIGLHVAWAAASGYWLARHFGASALGAGLAAVSYAFGGSVLFQYANVVFLVGAAWLPLAILAGDRMLRGRSARAAVALGAVLALMVLGGDPQMAYNALLLVGLDGLLLWREERRTARDAAKTGLAGRRTVLFGLALAAAALLAAVQILPSLEAAPHSTRALYDAPRNIYELAWSCVAGTGEDSSATWYDGLLGRTASGHERAVYQFSVAPWRAVELVWPNVTGQAFPTNGRWLDTLWPEGDLWTPSLYLGLLPLVLAAAVWSVRRAAPLEVRFLSWMVVIGGLASLGTWGLGFMLAGAGLAVGDEVGGLYWWLAVLLPKYVYFRFPAKWFVVANLGLAVLAARGWDRTWEGGGGRLRRGLLALSAVSALGLIAAAASFAAFERHGAAAAPDPIRGPLDWTGARFDAMAAFALTAVLSFALAAAFWIGAKWPQRAQTARLAAFGITLVDLAIAQGGLLLYAPAETWRTEPKVLGLLPAEAEQYRVFRQLDFRPPSWQRSFSPDRYTECVRWDRETLWPKYNLPYRVALVEASQTIASADYRAVLDAARRHNSAKRQDGLPDPSVLDLLAARAAIVGADARRQFALAENVAEGMVLGLRPQANERAWIEHRAETLPPFAGRSPSGLEEFTDEVLFPDGRPRDWRDTAVVETDQQITLEPRLPGEEEHCRIVSADPLRVEIEARLTARGLVVLADLDYPGWELTVETDGRKRPLSILRADRVLRGAVLPAGRHRLVYRYRPKSVLWGGTMSAAAWLALLVGAAAIIVRRTSRFGS